jgi:uncharacterized protein (DUF433 family)
VTLPIQCDPPPLVDAGDGIIYVSNTRIPLERVIRAFQLGITPEQLVQDFDVLTLKDVYAVINYYLHHRTEVDAYLEQSQQEVSEIRVAIEKQNDPTGIRARLINRHKAGDD